VLAWFRPDRLACRLLSGWLQVPRCSCEGHCPDLSHKHVCTLWVNLTLVYMQLSNMHLLPALPACLLATGRSVYLFTKAMLCLAGVSIMYRGFRSNCVA
jgi:hypothetical protein